MMHITSSYILSQRSVIKIKSQSSQPSYLSHVHFRAGNVIILTLLAF